MNNLDLKPLENTGVAHAAFMAILIVLALVIPTASKAQVNETALRLIGTIINGNSGGAVLQDGTGKQFFYKLYDKLPGGAKIIELRDDSIALKGDDGAVYDMYISHNMRTAGAAFPANNIITPRAIAPAAGTSVMSSAPAPYNRPPYIRGRRRLSSPNADEE